MAIGRLAFVRLLEMIDPLASGLMEEERSRAGAQRSQGSALPIGCSVFMRLLKMIDPLASGLTEEERSRAPARLIAIGRLASMRFLDVIVIDPLTPITSRRKIPTNLSFRPNQATPNARHPPEVE